MGYGIGKKDNLYAQLVRDIDAPKTVWMAIAVSLEAHRVGMDPLNQEDLVHGLMAEWHALHDNGIVPQKPKVAR
jgi:hypothetical protein